MQTTGNAAIADKAEKAGEKLAEKRRALGRGLESLLPGGPRVVPTNTPARTDGAASGDAGRAGAPVAPVAVAAEPTTGVELQAVATGRHVDGHPVVEIPLDKIGDNPNQTRSDFNRELLEELAGSIAIHGVMQPIVVRPGEGGRYILILGERRLRASEIAGKPTIPAIVKRVSEQQAAEMTIVENLQRQDLHCLEQAGAFAMLSLRFHLTQDEIGKRVGVSRETVANYLRLLKLPQEVIRALRSRILSFSHARQLLCLANDEQIQKLAQLAVDKKMSVLQLQDEVERVNMNLPAEPRPDKANGGARWVDPNVRAAQRKLETILGMRVRIRDRNGKGKITIEYGTLEDFDRVVGMLKGK
jgi:ParB family chromosome partitioning protein